MPIEFLNFQHLYYFWIVAREGGISRASEVLDISPATISAQVGQLERSLHVKLFRKTGRNICLTDVGHIAFRYAGQIFRLGRELTHAVKGWETDGPLILQVGVADAVPKLMVTRLLKPALEASPEVRLICREGRPELLLAELALHHLDFVLLDAPAVPGSSIRVFSRLVEECPIGVFGTPDLAELYRSGFPKCLEGAPVLLPMVESSIRKSFERWSEKHGIQPRIVGEFEDGALMKAFGETGSGLFPSPILIESDLERQYGVCSLGALPGTRAKFYVVTVERQLEHPSVKAICELDQREDFMARNECRSSAGEGQGL